MTLSPDLIVGVTLAIFRLSGNIPCWIETLKTWNMIFFQAIIYASMIMLLLSHQSLQLCFVLNFWIFPQTCQSFIPQTVKKSWHFFSVLEILLASFNPAEVKKLLNFLAMSCGFCIMILSTLISWGWRFDIAFCLLVISYYLPRPQFQVNLSPMK